MYAILKLIDYFEAKNSYKEQPFTLAKAISLYIKKNSTDNLIFKRNLIKFIKGRKRIIIIQIIRMKIILFH